MLMTATYTFIGHRPSDAAVAARASPSPPVSMFSPSASPFAVGTGRMLAARGADARTAGPQRIGRRDEPAERNLAACPGRAARKSHPSAHPSDERFRARRRILIEALCSPFWASALRPVAFVRGLPRTHAASRSRPACKGP